MTEFERPPLLQRRVLVIFPGALGDLVCAMPAIEAIARANTGAAIELMARADLAQFAVGRTVVTRAHSIDRREVGTLFSKSRDAIATASEFFGAFDTIDSFFASDDANFRDALKLSAAARAEVAFHPFRPDGDGHVAAAYLKSVGEDADHVIAPRIEPTQDDIESAHDVLALGADSDSKLVAIFPGSGGAKKNWPPDNFAELARTLSKDSQVAIVLGPAEESLRSEFAALAHDRGRIRVHCDLSLGTVAGIARIASAFVGNDSGVSHLAAAVGACGVAIFGPTDPARWRPLGRVTALRAEPNASIPVAEVASAVASLIAAQHAEASRIDRENGVA